MRTVSIRLEDLRYVTIPIGFVGENQYTQVRIDCKTVYDEYPNATAGLKVIPPSGGDAYPATTTRNGNVVIWDVTSADVTAKGRGEIQLSFIVDSMIAKSYVGKIFVERSITSSGEAPEHIEDWIDDAEAVLGQFTEMTAEAETLPAGSSASATLEDEDGHKVLTIGVPVGANGQDGRDGRDGIDGQDGYSPSASVSKSGDTTTITITDKDGTTTASVKDGKDGEDGSPGTPGADGYSPTATVSKSGSTATISITDKNGTTSATVSDGDPTTIIDDNAGLGDTNKVWSADKTKNAIDGVDDRVDDIAESLAPVESTSTATAAHAVGELFMLGDKVVVALSAIAVGDTITTTGATPNAAVTTLASKLVKDIQVNGTSILNNGVANVPVASENPGAVAIDGQYGINIRSGSSLTSPNALQINTATDSQVKAGSSNMRPVTPINQHNATFYGLAKAASDTTQSSSSNAVGVYTDAAKKAIRKMLGIPNTHGELIKEITTTEDLTQLIIDTDSNGSAFKLTKMIVVYSAGAPTTGTKDVMYTSCSFVNESDVLIGNIGQPSPQYSSGTANLMFKAELTVNDGMPYSSELICSTGTGSTSNKQSMVKDKIAKYFTAFRVYRSGEGKTLIPSGTNIKLYGIRYDE